ncbi:unnamed protein product [Caenorhabditis sp. 36 PRJEB53466]|nr:unnamed protein product [Caenorhabditis sp. 36 PRJEB53466]
MAEPPEEPERIYELVSLEGQTFEITEAALNQSKVLRRSAAFNNGEPIPIPYEDVTADMLQLVITYCENHRDEPVDDEVETDPRPGDMSPEDLEYLASIDDRNLAKLIRVANFLDIFGLLDICCKHVASFGNGLNSAEMKIVYGL